MHISHNFDCRCVNPDYCMALHYCIQLCYLLQMCIRINNIHLLITIFTALETHLYVSTRTEVQKPISAFGYISSDQGEPNSLLARQACQVHRLTPHRPRPQKDATVGLLIPSDGSSSQAKGAGILVSSCVTARRMALLVF